MSSVHEPALPCPALPCPGRLPGRPLLPASPGDQSCRPNLPASPAGQFWASPAGQSWSAGRVRKTLSLAPNRLLMHAVES